MAPPSFKMSVSNLSTSAASKGLERKIRKLRVRRAAVLMLDVPGEAKGPAFTQFELSGEAALREIVSRLPVFQTLPLRADIVFAGNHAMLSRCPGETSRTR